MFVRILITFYDQHKTKPQSVWIDSDGELFWFLPVCRVSHALSQLQMADISLKE